MIASIRHPLEQDASRLARLLHFTPWVHRHLGWRDALDYIQNEAFWLLEAPGGEIRAALCAPLEENQIAWLRLFGDFSDDLLDEDWQMLWQLAETYFNDHRPATVAALVLQDWMQDLLKQSGFRVDEHIINLDLSLKEPLPFFSHGEDLVLRPMQQSDLPAIAAVDAAAFVSLWQNSLSDLKKAYAKSSWAILAEIEEQPVGYLIAIQSFHGVHIARLAVHPAAQGRGVGRALCLDLLQAAWQRGWQHITVNTQESNQRALNLYQSLGFLPERERYPVFIRKFV